MRTSKDESQILLVLHTFQGDVWEPIELPLPASNQYEISKVFTDGEVPVQLGTDNISCHLDQPFSAVCLLLQKKQ